MRNASGAIVRVEEKEPWALHLLTSDSANAVGEDVEAMQPPAEPVLVELTTTGVELLLEKYVQWVARKEDGTIYFAALPKPFIVALIEYPNSAVPVVRAINTASLVTPSGRVIDGVGLDRATGLFHRIDPVLRACLPHDKPNEEEIKHSLSFLLDEWLVDVALDRAGKCVAIMLALTVLQRALLPERPAFFVTAGQRGGGKTTLIMMIIAAVLAGAPQQRHGPIVSRSARRRCFHISAKVSQRWSGIISRAEQRSVALTSRRRLRRRKSPTECWGFLVWRRCRRQRSKSLPATRLHRAAIWQAARLSCR
jgi:hypothetical protein